MISDLGSYNGTKLNGEPIASSRLKNNDAIQIGLVKLTFLTGSDTPSEDEGDSVVLSVDNDREREGQQIIQSSPLKGQGQSSELLYSLSDKLERRENHQDNSPEQGAFETQEYLFNLARSNKVLFVLYEISRQLHQIHDFRELLKKIMDLIFMVIDADDGFLVIAGGSKGNQLIPVVVKYRDGRKTARREIKASRTIIDKVMRDRVALLTSNAMADSRLDGAKSVMIQKIKSAICVPLWRKDKIIGAIQLNSVRFDNQFKQDDLELLKAIGSQAAMVLEQAALNEQIREEERFRDRLERFHSPQVIEMIMKGGQDAQDDMMEPKEVTATVLFTDIIGFTTLSETMPPREVNILLNRYFSRTTDIIFAHDGTLDKYIGDGLMAVFGVPMETDDHAERAVRAALEIRKRLRSMMELTRKEWRFDIRIGINTGRILAGNIGSPKRMEYTVIGDPVNLASRLESIARPNGIAIGEETYKLVKNRFNIQVLGARKVKGKSKDIMVYEVVEQQ
jgi:adenylate cyclase